MPDPLFTAPKIDPSTTDLGDAGRSVGLGGSSFGQAPVAKRGGFDVARALLFFGGLGPNIIAQEGASGRARGKEQSKIRDSIIKTADDSIKEQIDSINRIASDLKNQVVTGKIRSIDFPRLKSATESSAALVANAAIQNMIAAGIPENVARSKAQGLASAIDRLDTQMRLTQTPKEAGQAAGTKAGAELEAQLGRAPTERERGKKAGVVEATKFRNFVAPDGTRGTVDTANPAAMANLPPGTQLFTIQAQPTGLDFTTAGKKETEKARETVASSTGTIENLAQTLREFEKTQGAAGLRGSIAEAGGGILSQIPVIGEETGEAFSKAVGGASQERISAVRTQARFNVARMLRSVTGDESGRYTDRERVIAEEAVKTLDPTASFPQIRGALKTAMELDIFARERAKVRIDPSLSPFVSTGSDQLDHERLVREARKLMALGFAPEEAAGIAERLFNEMTAFQEQFSGR